MGTINPGGGYCTPEVNPGGGYCTAEVTSGGPSSSVVPWTSIGSYGGLSGDVQHLESGLRVGLSGEYRDLEYSGLGIGRLLVES